MTVPKMPSFREECEMLAALETFDPEAFRGDDRAPQAVCSFVLALALIYNDCKDANPRARGACGVQNLTGHRRGPKRGGAIAGTQLHAFRGVAGLLHELFELIRANGDVLRHDFFVSLVQHLHPKSREAWLRLLLRNKVFFHYDAKAIFTGYTQHFLGPGKQDDRAYVSRGASMRATRLFFADAAATGYLRSVVGSEETDTLKEELAEIIDRINYGLMMIVGTFIQRRGYSFRLEVD